MDTKSQVLGRHTATHEQEWQQQQVRNLGKIPARSHIPQGRQSEEATSPERRALSAPVNPNLIKLRKHPNIFQSLAEDGSQGSAHFDKVREGSISDASSSRGSKLRDLITLTPEILAMIDRHEPDKGKHAQLLTEHLAGQRVLPSTEEELQQHLERKAKRELNRVLAAEEATAHKQEQAWQAEAHQHAQNAGVVATFAKRAREAAIAAGATQEAAEAAATTATADAEMAFADAEGMQE